MFALLLAMGLAVPAGAQGTAPGPALSIRPFVMGRKAWLFSDTPAGAEASARLYGLIETAKANGLEPYAYLKLVFTELPKAVTLADVEALLPWHVARPATPSVAA